MRRLPLYMAGVVVAFLTTPAAAQMKIPTDMARSCVIDSTAFKSWFSGGKITANGPVNPASSVSFTSDHPNKSKGKVEGPNVCNFYQWGAQMFLWLTSPEGDGLVLDSPSVFTVTPMNKAGKRQMIRNISGANFAMALRVGKVDDIGEVGQAGSNGVLLSQKRALVYYGIHVNDVYGYFLSGDMSRRFLDMTDFPWNASDLKKIVVYARSAYGAKMPNPEALAMEMKTSWVDASTVPDPGSYVTVEAEVPVYRADRTNTIWTPSGTATKRLALTGIHIVGTVQDHPEFVWSTFEHVSNAPDADYYYINVKNQRAKQTFSSAGNFLFMTNGGSQMGANVKCAVANGDGIAAVPRSKADPTPKCPGGIVPSNTVRTFPWGSPANDQSAATLKNNTLLLSINDSVRSQLARGDVRKNYVQMGGIWTTTPPGGGDAPIPNQGGDQSANLRGSLKLFNATMETYTQGTSCFNCHKLSEGAPNSFGAYELSHIYSTINPLDKN